MLFFGFVTAVVGVDSVFGMIGGVEVVAPVSGALANETLFAFGTVFAAGFSFPISWAGWMELASVDAIFAVFSDCFFSSAAGSAAATVTFPFSASIESLLWITRVSLLNVTVIFGKPDAGMDALLPLDD